MARNHIKKIDGGVSNVSEIPSEYKLYHHFYDNPLSLAFIPEKHREHVFGIIENNKEITGPVYLMIRPTEDNSSEIKILVRQLINAYKNDERTFPLDLKFADIMSEQLRQVIVKELKINNRKNASRRTDEKAINDVAFAEMILSEAMNMKASDLHIEILTPVRAVIRLRVNKELFDYRKITVEDAKNIANIFYGTFVRGSEENQEQGSGDGVYMFANLLDGEFSRVIGDIDMKARMVNIGQNYQDNFNMVLRLIDKSKAVSATPYSVMNYSAHACNAFKILNTASRGMILVGGVTGSGKSTMMQNSISHEKERCGNTRKIYSIEQPIEQKQTRVTQINAQDSHESKEADDSSQDFSFENINRMLMRGDPDTISYGEIRDNTTAKAAVKGVESGHLVYGTMHIQQAMAAFSRFETFGVSTDKICRKSFINMIIFQHLIPQLCPHCSKPYESGAEIPSAFGELFAIKSFKGASRDLDINKVRELNNKLKPGESLLRRLQHDRVVSASDVVAMKIHISQMNTESEDQKFKKRLNDLMRSSNLRDEELNVRFRGDGCPKCFNGTIGVVPAAEIIIPDDKFLELVLANKLSKAENHWRSKLNGKSATQDTYDKILSGVVDPRMVEEELDEIGS
jgi:type II secretory ATPase GspE/PulE/Tfp pilus assembly ATPase PilB-like protein